MKKRNRKKLTKILIGIGVAWVVVAGLVAILFTMVPGDQWGQWRAEMAQFHGRSYGDWNTLGRGPGYGFPNRGIGFLFFIPGLITLGIGLLVYRWGKRYRSQVADPVENLRLQYAKGAMNDQEYTSRLAALEGKE
ncbi:MAG: hypothetical protein GW949_05035 [Spirochaetales bacterium]|nr:hypothetical protein [Spirochaetales bacterium]